jgi:hypothetical protein
VLVCPHVILESAEAFAFVCNCHAAVRLLQEETAATGSEKAAGGTQQRKARQDASPGRSAAAVLLEAAKMQHAEVQTCTALSPAVRSHHQSVAATAQLTDRTYSK